ncbi:endonuclease VIII [Atlantibacter hermannii]|uniref:endonuclease VIII n=2 Tax=Atlantibacter hermannii TaxID=565 RepID=UPI0005C1D990|nr:endonuclease VIII [Atlantibacter hermannii]MCQ4969848.1 endonuclease VIII [Enterobacteriaceae bacterium DFI.7.85]HAI48971.1 endonuclease VIII [Enterobacteriaceae bacterium]KIU34131.1 endonuclease VIII [Atlantibacter hermannii]MBW9432463.1 endonuclease VIII [Atlantibacter hermannii]MDQ7882969.1 endonuclease VIII [Atlantibacter hermannii]
MPEGPEIRRAADKLEQAVAGKPLTHVWFAFPELKPFETALTGERVERLETRGKALLTHFSNGLTLYSHNQLYGVWRVVKAGETPQTTRSLRVRLETEDAAVLLYSASDIVMLDADGVAGHAFLQRVGPDVLDMTLTVDDVKARLLSPRFRRRQFSGLLLDQAFLAGLGNYLRVEILWQAQLAPRHKAAELTEPQLDALAGACLTIPRLSYQTRGQVNENKHHGALFRFEVFHRAGKRCRRCGELIEKTTLSSRPFYWCPGCQK